MDNIKKIFASLTLRTQVTWEGAKKSYLNSPKEEQKKLFQRGLRILREELQTAAGICMGNKLDLCSFNAQFPNHSGLEKQYYMQDARALAAVMVVAESEGISVYAGQIPCVLNLRALEHEIDLLHEIGDRYFRSQDLEGGYSIAEYRSFLRNQFTMLLSDDPEKLEKAMGILDGNPL